MSMIGGCGTAVHATQNLGRQWIGIDITRAMERDAAAVGLWENPTTGRTYPRLQILTLAELFQGKRPNIPLMDLNVGKSAKREDTSQQGSLL